jgi:glutamyl-tRNA synthetase
MDIRVRYAPSPTGLQHIGGVRTALLNYLFARSKGGTFILRLEDTDRTRSAAQYVQNLYDTLNWLGIGWDEGPDKGGPYGPYVQSERFELYKKHASELVEKGLAYYCFCDEERLQAMRRAQDEAKSGVTGYDRHCRSLDPEETRKGLESGKPYVIRLKIPLDGVTSFHDQLLGDIEWRNSDVNPDPVLLKSDGFPTYHLANVVDDHYMKISHVMRAQEWIPSTPLHVVMYQAFGWRHPEYCHLPMVLGQDGHKLSKRHGATSVDEFRNSGYLPDALLNYVAMLGSSYEDGRDIYSLGDMERLFSLEKLNKAPAVFDYKKLEWFNGQYIRRRSDAELASLIKPFAIKAGLFGPGTTPPSLEQEGLLLQSIPLIKERISFIKEAPAILGYVFSDPPLPAAAEFIPKKLDAMRAIELLRVMQDIVGELARMPEEEAETLIRAKAEEKHAKVGELLMPLRVALTGSTVSPPLLGSIRILGAETVQRRISKALSHIADR